MEKWDHLDLLVLRETRDLRECQAQRDHLEWREELDHQDLGASLGRKERLGYQASQVPLVGTVSLASVAFLEFLDLRENQDRMVSRVKWGLQGPRDTREARVTLDLLVAQDPEAREERLDPSDPLERRDPLVIWADLDVRERMDPMEYLEAQELQVFRDSLVFLESRVRWGIQGKRDLQVLLVNLGKLDYQGLREGMEDLEHLALKDLKAHLEWMASMVNGDRLDLRARRENLAIKEVLDLEDRLVLRVQKEILVLQDFQEHLAIKDLQGSKENLGNLENMERKEIVVSRVMQVLLDNLENMERKEIV